MCNLMNNILIDDLFTCTTSPFLCTVCRWFDTANYFSNRGFSGLLLRIPDHTDTYSIDSAVDYLEMKRCAVQLLKTRKIFLQLFFFIFSFYIICSFSLSTLFERKLFVKIFKFLIIFFI